MPQVRFRLLSLCVLLIFLLPHVSWAGPAQDFQAGWRSFHKLRKTPSRAKYRSYWMQVKKHFQQAYRADPDGSYAPKSLYYLGRTYQELGKRSYVARDYRQAVDFFQRLARKFPTHSWTDDGKLYQAQILLNHLDDPKKAYSILVDIRRNHPDGDKAPQARALLTKLNSKYGFREATNKTEQACPQPQSSNSSDSIASDQDPGHLQTIRHWSSDDYTRVVLDLDSRTSFEHMLLKPDPKVDKPFYRVVVDVDNTRLAEDVPDKLAINDGILRRVRTGQYRPNETRIVLDVNSLDTYRTFALQNPNRVVVDVYAPKKGQSVEENRKALVEAATEQGQAVSASLVEQLGLDIQTIMIDPGHGGKDPGAVCKGILEKDINLRMAKILGSILEDQGYTVLYTRTKDVFIPLEERTAMANAKSTDLFLSLHVNAHSNSNIHGLEVYYLNLANSKEAVRVAARENAVSEKKISDLQLILSDLMLNSKINESSNLAQLVLDKTLNYGRRFYQLKDHGVRRAPFYVLMGAQMPAILVELGYLTNPTERRHMQNYSYLKRMAWGLAQGISAYRQDISSFAQR